MKSKIKHIQVECECGNEHTLTDSERDTIAHEYECETCDNHGETKLLYTCPVNKKDLQIEMDSW